MVIKTSAPACSERALAGWSWRFRIAIKGMNPRTNRPFIWHMFQACGGASSVGDGWPTESEGQAACGIQFGSIEGTEVRFPLFFKRHEFRPDSVGVGKYRGGVGSEMELQVEITEPAVANTAGDGMRHASDGLFGGCDGLPHRYRLISNGGLKGALPSIDIQTLGAGGGSMAHVDFGGILQVGPESAGSQPWPRLL